MPCRAVPCRAVEAAVAVAATVAVVVAEAGSKVSLRVGCCMLLA